MPQDRNHNNFHDLKNCLFEELITTIQINICFEDNVYNQTSLTN